MKEGGGSSHLAKNNATNHFPKSTNPHSNEQEEKKNNTSKTLHQQLLRRISRLGPWSLVSLLLGGLLLIFASMASQRVETRKQRNRLSPLLRCSPFDANRFNVGSHL